VKRFLQITEPFKTAADAAEALAALRLQVGCIGGRVFTRDHHHTAQAFFRDSDAAPGGWLPDGVRRVIILESQRRALGILD
jgi:hypothetical protein